MESNSNDNYVLVLENRTEMKNEKEAGKLSVISGIDDKGRLSRKKVGIILLIHKNFFPLPYGRKLSISVSRISAP